MYTWGGRTYPESPLDLAQSWLKALVGAQRRVWRREWKVWMRLPWSSVLRICAVAEAVREHREAAGEHFMETEPGPLGLGPDSTGSPTLFTGSLLASGRN